MKNLGKHFRFPPEPLVKSETRFVDAGCVKFGVEYRAVTNEDLLELYKGTPFEAIRGAGTPGLNLEGTSFHVCDAATGTEYVRFDVFDDDPHYHYIHPWTSPDEVDNHVVYWDPVAHGPMLPWVIESLRVALPRMLQEAGALHLVGSLDPDQLAKGAERVRELAEEIRSSLVPKA
jgi:hypothetical protein